MEKTAKRIMLTIAVLCLSISSALAGDLPSGNPIHSGPTKAGTGNFEASIFVPLYIYEVAPTPLFTEAIPNYVKGATYSLFDGEGSPVCQYSIRGEIGKNAYIKSITTTVSPTVTGTGTEAYNSVKDDGQGTNGRGVKAYMLWKVQNGTETIWDGVPTNPHRLRERLLDGGGKVGEVLIKIFYRKIEIDPEAFSGLHQLDQTIEVSYNPL